MIFRTKGGMTIDVEVFVNCKFGYDINCEVVCEEGTVKLAAPATPIIKSDASVATGIETSWINRFIESYDTELQDWVKCRCRRYHQRSYGVGRLRCSSDGRRVCQGTEERSG